MSNEIVTPDSLSTQVDRKEAVNVVNSVLTGDESALTELQTLFDVEPARMLAAANAGLTVMIEEATIARIAGGCPFTKEALPKQMQALRKELAGPKPSPVVRLLADRVALCWLDTIDWDIRRNRTVPLTDAHEEHIEKMRGRVIRRYLAALKELAQVRKLDVVAVQVNIDKQQINIEQAAPG